MKEVIGKTQPFFLRKIVANGIEIHGDKQTANEFNNFIQILTRSTKKDSKTCKIFQKLCIKI